MVTWSSHTVPAAGSIGPEWFDEQQFSGLSMYGMLFELIDNSIQHRYKTPKHHPLQIVIQAIQSSGDPYIAEKIRIIDNGTGISEKIIPKAFSPYGMSQYYSSDPASLSEHGMGMKKALRGLGSEHRIFTKQNKKKTFLITSDDIRLMPTKTPPTLKTSKSFKFPIHGESHGTIIEITKLEDIAEGILYKSGQRMDFEKRLKWALGQRYRYFLSENYFEMGYLKLQRLDHKGKLLEEIDVEPLFPTYYWNPFGNHTKPWFKSHQIKSDIPGEWEAAFTMGFAPRSKDEWADTTLKRSPLKGHPYYVASERLGFDIVRKGIVLQTGFFVAEKGAPGISASYNPVLNYIRGEIFLKEGFKSKEEKVGIHVDRKWRECINKITEILKGQIAGPKGPDGKKTNNWMSDYVSYKPSQDDEERDESNYRIGVINKINASKPKLVGIRANHSTIFPAIGDKTAEEHPPGWEVGEPDILIRVQGQQDISPDSIVGEVKAPETNIRGIHVYQLFCYMQEKGLKYGIIVGDGPLQAGANAAIDHIQNQYVTGPKGEKLGRLKQRRRGKYVISFWDARDSYLGIHATNDRILEF